MKYILFILLLPVCCIAQNTDTVDHVCDGEYWMVVYKASNHQVYNIFNIYTQAFPGQPPYVSEAAAGPHDAACLAPNGDFYVAGSVFGGTTMIHISVDSANVALPPVRHILLTGTSASSNFTDIIVTDDSTNGHQVGLSGSLIDGIRGNGTTTGATNQASFVWAVFPNGTHIKKVVGLDGVLALDSKGRVWSWGFANNKAKLMRGTSPAVTYALPDTVQLGAGRFAVDVCSVGAYSVILLDNGHVLGGGDHPKYWGGASASTSNSPQDFTAFLIGASQAAGNFSTPAKLFCNNGSIFYIYQDSTLWASGDNLIGTIGNGQGFNMLNYLCCPAPNSGSLFPYAYDNNLGEFPQYTPVQVCPGTHNWVCAYPGSSNSWVIHFVNNKGEIWGWGRDKSGQMMDGQASCNNVSGGLNSTYPDMIDKYYPTLILPFSFSSGTIITPTCFYCIANPGATNCSQGTSCYNGSLAAPNVVCEAQRTLSGNTTSFSLSSTVTIASGDHQLTNVWTQVSGPATTIPFHTPASPTVYVNAPGIYIFQDSVMSQMWKTGVAFDTVVIGNAGIGPIPAGVQPKVVKINTNNNGEFCTIWGMGGSDFGIKRLCSYFDQLAEEKGRRSR